MRKFILLLLIASIAGFLGWKIYVKLSTTKVAEKPKRGMGSVAVETRPVQKMDIRDLRRFTGTLIPDSQFIVAPKIPGRLEKLLVNIGDEIQQGQLIAVLDDEEYQQQVKQAVAQLNVAIANVEEALSNLDVAKSEFVRLQSLQQRSIVSKAELDVAEAKFKAAEVRHRVSQAQVAQKRAELRGSEVRLSYAQIHAAWKSGSEKKVVGERFVHEGAMLTANAPIVSVLDISKILGVIFVIEQDYPKIMIQQDAIVSTDAFAQKFPGKVVRIAPLLKESSRQARIEIEISNPRYLLKPGMFIRVEIEFERHDQTVATPLESLVKREGKSGVFRLDEKREKVQFIPVSPGIVQDEWVEILSPPIQGEVVVMGHHLLSDGASVILPEKEEKGERGKALNGKKEKKTASDGKK